MSLLNIKRSRPKVSQISPTSKSDLSTSLPKDDLKANEITQLVSQDNTLPDNSKENNKPVSKGTNEVDDEQKCDENEEKTDENVDDDLNKLNFHVMMFFMWLTVTIVNIPTLLTWARNFKYSMVLAPDTSYHTGLIMSVCSACVWQMEKPKRNLRYYEATSALLFTMAVFILALGPFSLILVNYGVTSMFVVITLQQLFDKEENAHTGGETPEENTQNDKNSQDDTQEIIEESEENKEKDKEIKRKIRKVREIKRKIRNKLMMGPAMLILVTVTHVMK